MTLTEICTVDRRRVLKGAATVGVAAVGADAIAASGQAAAPSMGANELVPTDPLLHLLRRATYGPTPATIREIRALGAYRWVEQQLHPETIVDDGCDPLLKRLPLIRAKIPGIRAAVRAGKLRMYGWNAMEQLGTAAVARAAWSKRQLFEMMVDFWGNHLNVTCPSSDVWDSRPDYDRTVIRRHALGSFADMLKASARHPAMLSYLNNRSSTKQQPNENYGRELLELHTVGLIHTEADVQQAARLLTGLTVDYTDGEYRYDAGRHATGRVRVLGFTHPNRTGAGGEAACLELLDYLARHPATARRIAHKLCVRFVADHPPASLVERLAAVYLTHATAIAPVLRELFHSAEFAAARGAKVRTPLEDLVATIRILGLGAERVVGKSRSGLKGTRALYYTVASAGHGPMGWAPPNGYPDVAAAWTTPSGYLSRWNTHLTLAAGWGFRELRRPSSMLDHLLPRVPGTYGGLIDALSWRLLNMTMRPHHTAALAAFFGKTPGSPLRRQDSALTGRFPHLVALILDSPYFLVR